MNDRQLLEHYAISPKRSLGQNFLHDRNMLEKIVALAELQPGETALEIGPGTGNLTRVLAQSAERVVAVELDDRLLPLLDTEFGTQDNVRVVHADILTTQVSELVTPPFVVVANVPYYITSAILRHLLENTPRPRRLVLTVQREVATRLVAQPGDMSILAVSVQFYSTPHIAMNINPGAFWPRPEVASAVVCLDVHTDPFPGVADVDLFFRVVRAGFGQKRKQLRNALSAGLGLAKSQVDELLAGGGIDGQRRAETLALAEWAALTQAVAQAGL